MTEWQPIETAPKDGTAIIYRGKYTTAGACRWWTEQDLADAECGSPEDYCAAWYDADDEDSEVVPTHWMPLPEPPK